MAASTSPEHKFITYNILSQSLCTTSSFSKYPAEHVDVDARWELIAGKLSAAMAEGAIISLQEVSQEWAARISILCSKDVANPYTPIWRPYGSDFSDNMGVALLVPINKYELAKVRIARVGKELSRLIPSKYSLARHAPPEAAAPAPSVVETAIRSTFKLVGGALSMVTPPIVTDVVSAAWTAILRIFGVAPAERAKLPWRRRKSPWATARARNNAIVYAVLKPRTTGFSAAGSEGAFAVSTYHMPCCFAGPSRSVMTLHTWAIARLLHEWTSADDGVPVALGGDFNYKPTDRQYRLLSAGSLLTDEEEAAAERTGEYELDDPRIQDCSDAPPVHDVSHRRLPEGLRFTSAYKAVHGAEPDMTNFNAADMVPGPDPFIDSLDFVWLSDGLKAVDAVKLPSRTDPEVVKDGPYPSATEPSDHVMVSITFRHA